MERLREAGGGDAAAAAAAAMPASARKGESGLRARIAALEGVCCVCCVCCVCNQRAVAIIHGAPPAPRIAEELASVRATARGALAARDAEIASLRGKK